MNDRNLEPFSQGLVNAVTGRLMLMWEAASIQLPDESAQEKKRFAQALNHAGLDVEPGVRVTLVVADLAKELVAHGYRGYRLESGSVDGAMNVLRIAPEDRDFLIEKLHQALGNWRIQG